MKYDRILVIAGALSVMLAPSCSSDDAHDFENKVFISSSSMVEDVMVALDEKVDKMQTTVSFSMADKEATDVLIHVRPAPELLGKYQLAYNDGSAVLLPESNYDISDNKAVIRAGQVDSESLDVFFRGLMSLDYSTTYVLPLTIDSVEGAGILENSRTIFYVVKEASLVNVVAGMNGNKAWPEWKDFSEVQDLKTFTMEALVNPTAFENKSKINTIMGIESYFLIRVGDVTIPVNQLQIAAGKKGDANVRASLTNADMQLKTGKWQHIAVTFDNGLVKVYIDGKKKGEMDFSATETQLSSVDFMVPHSDESDGKPRCFWIGYSYDNDRSFNGYMSEVRLWNKALTEEEINAENHFYKLNLKDESLMESVLAYWKFNDGNGSTVKDYSKYGNNLTAEKALSWKKVSLPEND